MNIIKRELRANLKALIIWIIALIILLFSATTEFEAYYGNTELSDAFDQFQDMFSFMLDDVDFTTPEGYLSVMSIYLYIPLSIYAALIGSSIISKEERDKTAEYLFTLPVKRNTVLLNKLITAVIYNAIINIFVILGAALAFDRFNPTDIFYDFLFYLSIGLFLTQIIFMSIGMFLAAILKQYKRSGSISLGILLGSYMLYVLVGLSDKISFLKYITPFKYFEVSMMLDGVIELKFLILTAVLIGACITGLFVFYQKRDLYI